MSILVVVLGNTTLFNRITFRGCKVFFIQQIKKKPVAVINRFIASKILTALWGTIQHPHWTSGLLLIPLVGQTHEYRTKINRDCKVVVVTTKQILNRLGYMGSNIIMKKNDTISELTRKCFNVDFRFFKTSEQHTMVDKKYSHRYFSCRRFFFSLLKIVHAFIAYCDVWILVLRDS